MSPPPYSGGDICGKTPAIRSKTSRVAKLDDFHSKLLFFVKNKGQWKRSKSSGWECCYANKIVGTFGVEMRASGQKLVTFCANTHTHAAKLVVAMMLQFNGG